jgi:hypothetical protein
MRRDPWSRMRSRERPCIGAVALLVTVHATRRSPIGDLSRRRRYTMALARHPLCVRSPDGGLRWEQRPRHARWQAPLSMRRRYALPRLHVPSGFSSSLLPLQLFGEFANFVLLCCRQCDLRVLGEYVEQTSPGLLVRYSSKPRGLHHSSRDLGVKLLTRKENMRMRGADSGFLGGATT